MSEFHIIGLGNLCEFVIKNIDEKQTYGTFSACDKHDRKSMQEFVDYVNQLIKENEQLKRQIGNLEHTRDFCADVCADCERLEKENEELKSENQYLKSLKWNKDCINEISIGMQQRQSLEKQNNKLVKKNEQLKQQLFETSKELLWATSDEVDRALHYEDEVEELRKEIFE